MQAAEGIAVTLRLLPAFVARTQKAAGALVVAVAMKPSRWQQLAGRGLFPAVALGGVAYFHLQEDASFPSQLPFDAMLHKVKSLAHNDV